MGRLWEKFREKFQEGPAVQELKIPDPPAPVPSPPMRAYRQEPLNKYQRRDLLDIVNTSGYEILLDLHESTLEGFITSMVEIAPEDESKVLAMHKLVHAGYLYNRSIQQQVEAYKQIEEDELRADTEARAELIRQAGDPLSDDTTFNRVLDPIYMAVPQPTTPTVVKPMKQTPLDVMQDRGV